MRELAGQIVKGDRRALAKAITIVENNEAHSNELMRIISKRAGRAYVVGVTGPPGTGKSTLVDRLVAEYRRRKLRVGVVAVDPTSPLTGGALLGDRVRMLDHSSDSGVFIRSMASRGWSGGLSKTTAQVVQLMDASGMDVVLIETVGIGQSDIEVVGLAHSVMVVLMPGLGDDVQMSKAGLMEVGDIYVVNKSDLEGADAMVVGLLALVRSLRGRSPSVLKVSAMKSEGVGKLVEALETTRQALLDDGDAPRLRSTRGMILQLAKGRALAKFAARSEGRLDGLAARVLSGELTVEDAADLLVD